jgi:hypothetical protein
LPKKALRVRSSECMIEILSGGLTAGALAVVDRGIVSMELLANREPLEEELDQEGTTGGLKGLDSLGMGVGLARVLKFPMDL